MLRSWVLPLSAATWLTACGGSSSDGVGRGGAADPGRDAGASGGSARGSGGSSGTPDASVLVVGSGGSVTASGGTPGIGPDAAARLIDGISGPGGPCAVVGMTCDGGSTLCHCAPGKKWDCGGSPDASNIVLPARVPNAYDSCRFDGLSCTAFEECSPTCRCDGGAWSCTLRADCVPPGCSASPVDGAACDEPGRRCSGGCRSCECDLTPDLRGYAWACTYFVC